MMDILLPTKIGRPTRRSVAVSRIHLVELASKDFVSGNAFLRKLTLVSAPAGYGKTSMVSDWLDNPGWQIAWLSLDEADNDPIRFYAYLIAALQSIQSRFGESLLRLIQSPQAPPQEMLLTILVNELTALPPLSILVLDDYHAINNLAIHRGISFLLERLPSNLHFVLITRQDPLIPISRYRARNQVLEIRQEALRFSLKEISEFMSLVMQLDLSHADIIALEHRTEGWIAGLQLAGLSLKGLADKSGFIREFTGSNRYILDYLIEEVINRQPEDVRDFLLKTAILNRLSGSLCDAVTGGRGSQELLERLDRFNMFIVPLDQSRSWYRYHHLFLELLRHQWWVTEQPIDESVLHLRAGRWFEAKGFYADAIQHALEGQNWAKAAQLIGQVNEKMFKHGEVLTLLGWLEKLPMDLVLSQLGLCMAYAWTLLLTGKYNQAQPILQQGEKLAQPGSIYLGQVATAQAYLARSVGDNPGVIASSNLALSLLPKEDFSQRSTLLMNLGMVYWHEGNLDKSEPTLHESLENARQCSNLYAQLTSEIFLARTLASRGSIQEAKERYPSILEHGPLIPVSALAYIDLATIYYEFNVLDKAEIYLQQGLQLSEQTGTVEFQIAGLVLQCNLSTARQDWSGAHKAGDQAWMLAQDFSAQTKARCAACQAQVALAEGELKPAAHWFEQNSPDIDAHNFYRFCSLLRPRLLIAQGKRQEAAGQLKKIDEAAKKAGWGYALLAIRCLQAMAATSRDEAFEFLADAIHRAEPEGFIRTFTDSGIGLLPVLRDAANSGIAPTYVAKILSSFGGTTNVQLNPLTGLPEPLSEREVEVLKLVSAGLSNREIAGKLFISPGTAKTHIHNLFGKLGVSNRTQAAGRAKELGLL